MKIAIATGICALLFASAATALDCGDIHCWEPRGGNLPIERSAAFCYGDGNTVGFENGQEICRCRKDGCGNFISRCRGRGWLSDQVSGCFCQGDKAGCTHL
ncbi:hypothetical protein GQ44DRAFT_720533 [Phaeosphaeriaceae sp. PMI808]|nr:hypothetical protein GQ44DRAFT_720533 [Phaeosphaeriaceae sp. PMI808]